MKKKQFCAVLLYQGCGSGSSIILQIPLSLRFQIKYRIFSSIKRTLNPFFKNRPCIRSKPLKRHIVHSQNGMSQIVSFATNFIRSSSKVIFSFFRLWKRKRYRKRLMHSHFHTRTLEYWLPSRSKNLKNEVEALTLNVFKLIKLSKMS